MLDHPPAAARASLRTLSELGLLDQDMVWGFFSQSRVDPLFLIRLFREHKAAIGFVQEEIVVGMAVAFNAGDKDDLGYKASVFVDVFTNNMVVTSRRDGTFVTITEMPATDLYKILETYNAGEARLAELVAITRRFLEEALK